MNGVNGLGGGGGGGSGFENNAFWTGGGAGGSGVLIFRVTDPDSPNGTAGVSHIGPQHATLSATVTSFGGEATKAFVSMVYGTSQDGADAVTAFQDVEVVEEGAGASALVSGLGLSVRYYALATISNEFGSVVYRRFDFVSSDKTMLDTTSYRKKVEVTVSGYTGSETLRDFPVLLRLRSGTPRGFLAEDCAAGGADLRFADADGSLLDSEVEVWDPDGESIVWVRVPELPPSGTTFTMRYAAVPSATLQPVDSAGVWKGYAGVWHMNDEGSGYTHDATANANHGTDKPNVKPAGTGPVGGARNMGDRQGSDSGWYCGTIVPADTSLDVAPNFSFSFWSQFHVSPDGSWSHFLNRRKNDGDTGGWALQWRNGSLSFATCGRQDEDGPSAFFNAGAANAVSNWTHVVCSVAGSEISLYLNGVHVGTKTATAGAAGGNGRELGIGSKYTTTGDVWGGLNGDMDEVRLRVGAVSADWAQATHASMASGSFVSYSFTRPTVILIR